MRALILVGLLAFVAAGSDCTAVPALPDGSLWVIECESKPGVMIYTVPPSLPQWRAIKEAVKVDSTKK